MAAAARSLPLPFAASFVPWCKIQFHALLGRENECVGKQTRFSIPKCVFDTERDMQKCIFDIENESYVCVIWRSQIKMAEGP